MLHVKLNLGDELLLTNEQTGEVVRIDIDKAEHNDTRLSIDAPKHIKIKRVPLDQRTHSDPRYLADMRGLEPGIDGREALASRGSDEGGAA